jgi:hypothetical protein
MLLVRGERSAALLHLGHFMGNIGALRPRQMNFGEWMAVQLTPEQQFEIEKQARSLINSPDAGTMAAALLKQACYQQQLLQQAVNEIARLECELMKS